MKFGGKGFELTKSFNQHNHSKEFSGLYCLNTTRADLTVSTPPVSPLIFEVTTQILGMSRPPDFQKTKIMDRKIFFKLQF